MSQLVFQHDRAGYTGPLRATVRSEASHGALGAAGLGPASYPQEWVLEANGNLPSTAQIAGVAPGAGPMPPLHRLTVYQGARPISSVTFTPIETAPGIVSVLALLKAGQAQVAAPEQLAALSTMLDDGTVKLQAMDQALADTAQATTALGERVSLLDALTDQGTRLTPALIWPGDRLRYTGFPNNVVWDPGAEWTYIVTGAEGDTTLSVNTAQSSPLSEVGTASWAANILHDDGVYRVYPVTGANPGAGTLTLGEPLRAAATNAPLHNNHWHSNHLTPSGYDVLAQTLVDAQQADATARYALAASHGSDTTGTWEAIGWLTTGGLTSAGDPKGIIYDDERGQTDPDLGGQLIASSIGTHTTLIGMDAEENGAQQRSNLAGRRGTLRATIGVRRGVALIEVRLDGVVVATRVQPRGNVTLTVPFSGAQEGTVRVQQHTGTPTTAKVGRVEWRSAAGTLTGPVLADGDVILLHGDSWTQFHNRRWQTSMVSQAAARGRTLTFVNTGKGGMTSRWGLWWLEYQLQQHPEVTKAILEFGVNDSNGVQTVDTKPDGTTAAIGPVDLTEYLRNMADMVNICQRYGVQPIVVGMSVAGHPDEQALRGQWSEALGRPDALPVAGGTDPYALGPWLSDETLPVSAAPVALTVPALAGVSVVEAQLADLRFRFGGLAPDATHGHDLRVGERVALTRAELLDVRFVRAGSVDGQAYVDYHGSLT